MDIRISARPADSYDRYRRRMEAIGQSFARAMAYSLNGVAIDAKRRILEDLPRVIDQPSPFTVRGFRARLSPLTVGNVNEISTALTVLPDQSTYLKYLFGADNGIRLPGDVGPATHHVYVPIWANLERYEGARPRYGGGMSRQLLTRLAREAGLSGPPPEGEKPFKRRGSKGRGRGQIFFGAPVVNGKQRQLGYWSRARRVRVDGRWVSPRGPRLLVAAVERARYQPVLVAPWDKAVSDAYATLEDRLRGELSNRMNHLWAKGELYNRLPGERR
jgi:hypothetical protein